MIAPTINTGEIQNGASQISCSPTGDQEVKVWVLLQPNLLPESSSEQESPVEQAILSDPTLEEIARSIVRISQAGKTPVYLGFDSQKEFNQYASIFGNGRLIESCLVSLGYASRDKVNPDSTGKTITLKPIEQLGPYPLDPFTLSLSPAYFLSLE